MSADEEIVRLQKEIESLKKERKDLSLVLIKNKEAASSLGITLSQNQDEIAILETKKIIDPSNFSDKDAKILAHRIKKASEMEVSKKSAEDRITKLEAKIKENEKMLKEKTKDLNKIAKPDVVKEKVTISVGQALLILMDKYKGETEKVKELKKLYLSGAKDDKARERIETYLEDEALQKYTVSKDPKVIDRDPARRYFETHLSYETLKSSLGDINADMLQRYTQSLFELLPQKKQDELRDILEGKIPEEILDARYKGISDAINRIEQDSQFKDMSTLEKENLKNLTKCSILAVILTQEYGGALPLDIYGTGFYGDDRGRIKKEEDMSQMSSQAMGLIKGHMPLSSVDVAFSDQPFIYPKPSDHSTFDINAGWVKNNFELLVHPFSNSLSGTMLAQLRSMLYLKQRGTLEMNNIDQLSSFLKALTATLLFKSGGHTLHEFTGMLPLPETQAAFSFVNGFNGLNLETLFYDEKNRAAFDAALDQTLLYNQQILQRRELMASMPKAPIVISNLIETSEYFLGNYSNINLNLVEGGRCFLAKSDENYIFVYKTHSGIVYQYTIETTPDGFQVAGRHFKIEKEDDFDGALNFLAEKNLSALHTAISQKYKINAALINEFAGSLAKCTGDEEVEKMLSDSKAKNIINLKKEDGSDIFSVFVLEKQFKIAEQLLKYGAKPDVILSDGNTLLMNAASEGDMEKVEFLLKHGANATLRNKEGDSALTLAIKNGHNNVADLLLGIAKTPELEKKDKVGSTAFLTAVECGNTEMALKLISRGVRVNVRNKKEDANGLMYAALRDNRELIDFYLKRPDIGDIINLVSRSAGETAVVIAAKNGHYDLVKLLVKHGADPNISDFDSVSPLKLAQNSSDIEMIKFLLENNATPDIHDDDGNTLVMTLISAGEEEMVKSLLKNEKIKPLLNDVNFDGKTALHLAIEKNLNDMVLLLLEHGASPLQQSKEGLSPLEMEAKAGNLKVVEAMLNVIKPKDSPEAKIQYRKALEKAFKKGHVEVVKSLINAGANILEPSADGKSLLAQAVIRGKADMVDLFVKNGADANVKSDGKRLIDYAKEAGFTKIVEILKPVTIDFVAKNNEIIKTHPSFKNVNKVKALALLTGGDTYVLRPDDSIPGCFVCSVRKKEGVEDNLIRATDAGFEICYQDKEKRVVGSSSHASLAEVLEKVGAIAPLPKARETKAAISFSAAGKRAAAATVERKTIKERPSSQKPDTAPPA